MPKKIQWTEGRVSELLQLHQLLVDLSHLNSGSHFIQKTQRAITVARRLTHSNINKPRPSFYQFLVEQAANERGQHAAGKGAPGGAGHGDRARR